MSRLFDTVGYRESENSTAVKLAQTHALYVLEENAITAARAVFAKMGGNIVAPLLYLPLPLVCFEWRLSKLMQVAYGQEIRDHRARVLAIMEQAHVPIDAFTQAPPMDVIYINLAIELDNTSVGFASAYFGCTSYNDKIPWDYNPPRKGELEIAEAVWVLIIDDLVSAMAFLNSPNLHETERVDCSKLNRRREGRGQPALADYTVIRPNANTKQWVRDKRESEAPGVSEHWVKAHKHTYLTGPGRHKPIVKLIAPFKRGDPEVGVREPRYVVKGTA